MTIAIETRILPVTNYRPTRIVATTANRQRLVMSKSEAEHLAMPSERDDDAHRAVAQALADKMQWQGQLIAGSTKAGYVFVFADGR